MSSIARRLLLVALSTFTIGTYSLLAQAPAGQGDAGRGGGAAVEPDFTKQPPVLPLTPEEEGKKFLLPAGFTMTPVLADPEIQEPAEIAFDGNGRMFVLELRGYMQDADGSGTLGPTGRISVHEDRDSDGVYETHHVFVDHLIFPRFVMPFGKNAVLAKESNADEVWKYTDTDGDGTADKKELFATGFGRVMNVEHQEGGLMWTMDNWMYSTINTVRLRWTPNGVLREPTGSNQGQWSVTQDNYGKQWFQAGASGMPGYFQTPVVYGNFTYPDQFEPNLSTINGAPVRIADMQGGMNVVRWPDGSLKSATGSAGNDIYRGDRLPTDMIGDLFYGEVVGRVVRRLHPVKTEGLTQLRNVYPMSEFIRTTDPLFRPVDMTTAPDGTMYITDMYRGIIQESQWSGPGTYLRSRIEQYSLDKVINHGRIWRLTYEGMGRRTTKPRMLDETAAQLVTHLSDPNGWWRDTAQQLLVLKQDTSVVPALTTMARTSSNQLARIHALWTLDGLDAADAALVRALMKDGDPQIRLQAIRASESLYKKGDRTLGDDWKALTKDADPDVVMQAMMTLNTLKVADGKTAIKAVLDTNQAKGPHLVANTIVNPPAGGRGFAGLESLGATTYTSAETSLIEKGQQRFGEVCYACHGEDGRGEPLPGEPGKTHAPALAASPRVLGHPDYIVKVLLHGLTGPVDGTTYGDVMIPMGMNNDEWIASVASYVRNAFGNKASVITPEDVARVRASVAGRTTQWKVADLDASLPRQMATDASWKWTASHNSSTAYYAPGIQPWSSGVPQTAGMWLQVELPQATTVSELQFESSVVPVVTEPIIPGQPPRTVVPGGGRGGRGGARGGGAGADAAPAPAAPGVEAVGYPRGYQVQTSMDGATWSAPVAEGAASGTSTRVVFTPVRAKFVRITQTATTPDAPPFAVQRLKLFAPGTD
jgi:mono/diheme cytochrome c family protein